LSKFRVAGYDSAVIARYQLRLFSQTILIAKERCIPCPEKEKD
jgi:hypothetical protein